jgi:hypothetical protein
LNRRALEAAVEYAATEEAIAWFPHALRYVWYSDGLQHIATLPGGRTWVGASGSHLYIFTLEGGDKGENPKLKL